MAGRVPPRALGPEELEDALAGRGLGEWRFVAEEAAGAPASSSSTNPDELGDPGDKANEPVVGELVRELRFPSFAAAIAFLAELAPACDAADHHPTWTNTYDRVEVRLATHEAGGRVTDRDLDLAAVMEARFRDLHGPAA